MHVCIYTHIHKHTAGIAVSPAVYAAGLLPPNMSRHDFVKTLAKNFTSDGSETCESCIYACACMCVCVTHGFIKKFAKFQYTHMYDQYIHTCMYIYVYTNTQSIHTHMYVCIHGIPAGRIRDMRVMYICMWCD
jgi:hypothetical protein